MAKKSILAVFLVLVLMLGSIPVPQQLVKASAVELKGTDIYNGLRGQSFNEGWKFSKGDVSNGQGTGFNDSGWSSVTLPHDWSIFNSFNQFSPSGSGGGYLDGGIGWYRKTFTVPSNYSGSKVFIEFDGAYMNSQVWINGTSLGTRPYGYSSFEYDLTPYLNFNGNNVIAVKLNNNQPTSRWYSGSGIYRNVWLTVLDPIHVGYCGMFVTTPTVSSSSATANVSTKVLNQGSSAKSVSLTTSILDANGNIVATDKSSGVNIAANGNNTFSQNLSVSNPHLWSTVSPYLYTVQTEVVVDGNVVDTYKSTMGFRYFNFSSTTGFSLNGVNMKMNGVCLHHDLGALGAAVNYRAIERELRMMKDMGCNAIRTSHNPPDPQLLEICDRLGLMVMDEAFDCWETGKTTNDYHLYFNNWAQTDLQAMVARDRNHPSIIMWSVGNEIPSPTVATATKLKNWVKEIDSTRPVTWGCFAVNMGDANYQAVASVFDLQGYNYFPYTYDSGHSSHPQWKMFGSETSSAVRSRGIYKTPITQNILTGSDKQCSSYDNSVVSWGSSAESSYTEINKRNYMFGEFIWTGFDYIGEPTPYEWPSKSSYFGIVDTCGFPKDIYYFYQSKWTSKPMVHILPHWNWSNGTSVDVWAYSNCDTVELFLNGTSLGAKSVGSALHLSWKVNWTPGTLRAKGTKGGTVVYDEVVTAGAASKVLLKPDRTSIKADGKDLVYIEADIADANNVTVPTADNTVNFSISGPGTIVGVDNGNGASIEPYKASSRKAFSGKCLVIVQPAKTSGTITVTATSGGLSQASVTINSGEGSISPTPTETFIPSPTPDNTVNLALNKAASSDSEETLKGNIASNANDGNALTRWCAADGGLNHWWKVDLGANYNLTGTEVMWELGGKNYKYKIEVSPDNISWITAADKTNNTSTDQTQRDNFTADNIRFVRITVTGLDALSWASMNEFKVFGTSGADRLDLNGDGAINISDVMILAAAFNSVKGDAKYIGAHDLNGDGAINISDIMILAAKFNTVIPK